MIITLKTPNGDQFELELTGPKRAPTGVIMVHGFGVRRDSRGLFTDVEANLGSNAISIRSDFSDPTPDSTTIIPISMQVDRLKTINRFVNNELQITRHIFIGHSQGCLVTALSEPQNRQVLLLAPPMGAVYERFIKTPGWSRPGSVLDIAGESHLKRSDGSFTLVGADFWPDLKQIGDAEQLYRKLAADNDVCMIFAGADNVLVNEEPLPDMPHQTISAADHDFSGSARSLLVKAVINHLRL